MPKLYTIGHSTHTIEEFISILHAHKIDHLVDIRTVPKSRHVPWFNEQELSETLKQQGIQYTHLERLGGLRHTHKDSINLGWHNASFRGFADYMQTPEFFEGRKQLNGLMRGHRVAIMCAEAVPWRCHRSLIADAEVVRHIKVMHIMGLSSVHPHKLTPFAVVDRERRPMRVYYPGKG